MNGRERMEQGAGHIYDLYTELQNQLYLLIINALKNADYKHVDQGDVLMWQMQQLNNMNRLNDEAVKALRDKDGLSEDAIRDFVKFHGLKIIDEVDDELKQAGAESQPVSERAKQALGALAAQTAKDLQNNINETLVSRNMGRESGFTKAYRQVLTESTTATVTGYMTHEQAVNRAVYKLVDKGFQTPLIDKGGRGWSVDNYARTVLYSTANRTFNELRLMRMKDHGLVTALMSSHMASRPACAPIQGHVVNVVDHSDPNFDKRYPTIYDHDYGEPGGTQGVNCRHILTPFNPETMENHEPQVNPTQAIRNGEIIQRQRAKERAIRSAKRRIFTAEALGDEKMANRAKTLLRSRQKKLRAFIKDTNQSLDQDILVRDYSREKFYPGT
ncbi:MAG: phage minor capsid protein [Limosilactobacillus sp.]|nr:phage minor capsid protein [Limosilactobacillus sp.]